MDAPNVTYVWLFAGIALVLIDALHLGGVGLTFAGFGAITTGAALYLHKVPVEDQATQWIVFFAATALWTIVLWKPLQKMRVGRGHARYSNIVGETAYVGSNGLSKRRGGEVTWSGTIMKAQLDKSVNAEALEAGSQVTIVEVTGATLIVKPKP